MGSPISSFLFQTFQLSMIWPMPQKIKCSSCGKGWGTTAVHEICTKRPSLIANEFNGVFPKTIENCFLYLELVHTRPLISSICFHLPHAVVDGNVYRVLARYFGIEAPIDTGQAKKRFKTLANELLDAKQPGNYNQAIMEFGALQCKPKPQSVICAF